MLGGIAPRRLLLLVLVTLCGCRKGWSWTPVTYQGFGGPSQRLISSSRRQAASTERGGSSSLPTGFPRIVTCSTTGELAQAVEEYVEGGHLVAELGSQLREVSTKICQRCQHATLVDVTRKFPKARKDTTRIESMRLEEGASAFFPDRSTFVEIPHLSDWPQAFFGRLATDHGLAAPRRPYDVLVLDVNAIVGNDLEWTSLQLIQQFQSWNFMSSTTAGEELIVLVKSVSLNQWASRLLHVNHWKEYHEDLRQLPPPQIVATRGVQEYRSTIPHTVRPTDFCLEVGCHFGTSTALLDQAAAHCIGVDVGSKIIQEAKKRHPGVDFQVGDAWKMAELLRFQQDYYNNHNHINDKADKEVHNNRIGYDVVYVDVGGLSGSDGIWEAIQLISSLRFALEPRTIVIKSLCMQRLSSKLMPFWQLRKRKQAQERVESKCTRGPELN